MTAPDDAARALERWREVPGMIERAIEGLPDAGLDLRGGADGWSIRETVHHLVEAHLIASNMMLAALAGSRTPYDWSWVDPDAAWMTRLGYTTAPVGPAIALLRSLCEHLAGIVAADPDRPQRCALILDTPGAAPYARTIAELVTEQIEHAHGHITSIQKARSDHGR